MNAYLTKFRKITLISLLLVAIVAGLSGCQKKEEKTITVFAAASTTDIMEQIAAEYEKETSIKVKLNLASSGKLARQIEAGAPADVFISASLKWMKYLNEKDMVSDDQVFLKNSLVLITNKDNDASAYEKAGAEALITLDGKISIGDPEHVPAGAYAKEALESLDLYTKLEKKMLFAESVRAALTLIEMNESEAGVVYKTDAMASAKVKVVYEFPEETHKQIAYPCSLVKGGADEGKEFLKYITGSDYAKDLYVKSGFTLP